MSTFEILMTGDGSHTLQSDPFQVTYHSIHGAMTETEVVFLGAGFRQKKEEKGPIKVLETGFGTGLNAYMTLLETRKLSLEVEYTSLEAYPVPLEIVKQLNYPEILGDAEGKDQFLELHDWSREEVRLDGFCLKKHKENFETFQTEEQYDVVYFDAFAPTAQPEFWEIPFLEKIFSMMNPGGVLVTYCAKGSFKRNLKAVGFEVEALPGPPRKREITRAVVPS